MSHRVVTTTLAAIAAIATTVAVAMAAAGPGPRAHAAALETHVGGHTETITKAGFHTVTASCPHGSTITGGGTRIGGTVSTLLGSLPSHGHDGWVGVLTAGNPAARTVHVPGAVYAVCLTG